MKKYIIKLAKCGEVPAYFKNKKFNTTQDASDEIINFVSKYDLNVFDFTLEEIDVFEPVSSEIIKNFDAACKYLHLGEAKITTVVANQITKLVKSINPAHVMALSALNELFTIAEAWNKQDGFVPDFSDWHQNKWFPWFKYDKDAAAFVYAHTTNAATGAYASIGSRLCFKSRGRAAQFGKRFAGLYNSVFLPYYLYPQE